MEKEEEVEEEEEEEIHVKSKTFVFLCNTYYPLAITSCHGNNLYSHLG